MEDFTLKNKKAENPLKPALDLIATLDEGQKMALRNELDVQLCIEIKNLNLTEELGLIYRQGKILLASIQNDMITPANQKAQVFTALNIQLDKIVNQRQLVFSQERLKRFESAFLKALEQLGNDEARREFFDLYGSFLQDKGV